MPATLTYPGVYIQEIPSGVRTIVGVATSITAFIGRTRRGPTNDPITINGFADFERIFGGLWELSPVSFAVRDFYRNGGSRAVIVRLYAPFFADDAARAAALAQATTDAQAAADAVVAAADAEEANAGATADSVALAAEGALVTVPATTLNAAAFAAARQVAATARAEAERTDPPAPDAASVDQAANDAVAAAVTAAAAAAAPITRARLSVDTLDLEAAYPGAWGNALRARVDYDVIPGAADLFNVTVRDGSTTPANIETFRNVSVVANHKRNVTKVLEQNSKLVRVRATGGARPAANAAPAAGTDPFAAASSSGVNEPASDGNNLTTADYTGSQANKTGIYALEKTDLFNILCIPPYSFDEGDDVDIWSDAAGYCERRRAMLIVDAPGGWGDKEAAKAGVAGIGTTSKNSALFFPRLRQPNLLRDNQVETFAACGAVAGIWARTDSQRGVWKAPAGLEATLVGVPELSVSLTDGENGELNPLGINCLRAMPPAGRVIWGARTLEGDDRRASEWKYIPVRRTALFIEETLYRNTQWVVFEPNDEPLWAQIRLNIGAFMHNLFRQGAFQGQTPKDAYFVKCDKETTTQNDIDLGVVNIVVGFAPLKPAEFVVITIQQIAGQIEV
jgi:phage tail sheath protein FI